MKWMLVFLYLIHQVLGTLLGPLAGLFASRLRSRWRFEAELADGDSQAEVSKLFHVSSEGEWEQVYPLIEVELELGRVLELVVTSESLARKLDQLNHHPRRSQIRLYRLQLLRTGWWRKNPGLLCWSRARDVYLCRYDFYPELMRLGVRARARGGHFTLLAASLIGKDDLLQGLSWRGRWLKGLLELFDQRVLASRAERGRFAQIGPAHFETIFDFREGQILKRLSEREETLNAREMGPILDWLRRTPRRHRLIGGSFWAQEVGLFQGGSFVTWLQAQKFRLLLVPHDLRPESLKAISQALFHTGFKVQVSQGERPISDDVHVVILNQRGVLVEFYPEFEWAYVGGGFGRSIHSVKEPFLAGCHIFCGPKLHRSTEWEELMARQPERLHDFVTQADFAPLFQSLLKRPPGLVKDDGPSYTELYSEHHQRIRQLHAELEN